MKTKNKRISIALLIAAAFFSCKKEVSNQSSSVNRTERNQTLSGSTETIADFEDNGLAAALYASETLPMDYTIENNPYQAGINTSLKCGKIISTSSPREYVATEKLDGKFPLASPNNSITMRVSNPLGVGTVTFSLSVENTDIPGQTVLTQTITQNIQAGTWKDLVFTFSGAGTNTYNKIKIYFEDGRTVSPPNRTWYFDDIVVPQMTYPVTLFNRVSPGYNAQLGLFIAKTNVANSWYKDHIAGVTLLKPVETKDGKWRMYVRGSGNSHSTIGMFEQASASLTNPTIVGTGGWKENSSVAYPNPVLNYGSYSWEAEDVANPVTVVDANKNLYLYYVGKAADGGANGGTKSIGVASSTDTGGLIFTKSSTPLKQGPFVNNHGVTTSVLFKNNIYYHFNHGGGTGAEGSQIWLGTNSSPTALTDPTLVVAQGTTYDSRSVQAGRVFKIPNDPNPNRRYMVYSSSATNGDYPNRFHCAYSSDDWLTWTKVTNNKPFFLRGKLGQWDQGAVWSCDVLEYNGDLYMYYEGWGRQGTMTDRNEAYSGPGGASQLGVAKVSVSDFLNWVAGL